MLKLYHFWSSTCSRKVRICLAEKEVEWESCHVDIVNKNEHLQNWYLELNPNGVVPTLVHNNQIIIESNIIIEYLDDCFPGINLKPKDPYNVSQVRLWLNKAETEIHNNVNIISWNKRHMPRMAHLDKTEHLKILNMIPDKRKRHSRIRRLEEGVTKAEEKLAEDCLHKCVTDMESILKNQTWLVGTKFSLADIAITPFLERFEANGLHSLLDFERYPNVGNWWNRLKSRYSYKVTCSFSDPNAKT